jgi:hypothetical protein
MTYATLEGFYDRLKPEAIANYERRISKINLADNSFTVPGHGALAGYAARFIGADLPTPLNDYTLYYLLPNGSDFVRVSATSGGSAITLTDAGSGLLPSFVVDMAASIERELVRQGARIDSCLRKRGIELPLTGTFPDLADLEIDLAVWKILLARGYQVNRETNPDQDYKVLWEAAEERLRDICGKGPLPDGIVDPIFADYHSEAWDPNLRGWKDDRYGEEGV